MKKSVALLAWLLLTVPSVAKKNNIASDSELAAITARGRMLAEYDVAAWHATDALRDALKADDKPPHGNYVAKKTDGGWVVVFGKVNDGGDKYLVFYEATQGATPVDFTVKKYDPPREDSKFYLFASRALSIAMKDFERPNRPYNTYVLPTEAGQLYVYLLPA